MKSLQNLAILLLVVFKVTAARAPICIDQWVVWNVGQGQWVTHITADSCLHFDFGGEFNSFKSIKKSLLFWCAQKQNQLNLTHWDYDHFLNIFSLAQSMPQLCWQTQPQFGTEKSLVQKVLALQIKMCNIRPEPDFKWTPHSFKNTNEASLVFKHDHVLSPGDSPIQQEKLWAYEMSLQKVTVLILGHHGSRTSTGNDLLDQLPNLKFSIASARFEKYKHPHAQTLQRLKQHFVPVLKTEDWGNIWFRP